MQKKMLAACTAFCALAALMVGCTDVSGNGDSQTPVNMTAETTASEEAAETQPAETETAAEDTETIDTTAAGETADPPETTAAVTAEAAASQGTVGDTGMTESEWVAQAQQMYEKAAQTYYTYLCSSSGFTYDTEDTIADDYVRITSCDTLEDAEAPYYAVFAKSAHASDFDGMLEMSEDKLYGRMGDRGADISYVSSAVTALTASTSSQLTFAVTSRYEDPEDGSASTKEDTFTLVLEDGSWRVGQFTMPY